MQIEILYEDKDIVVINKPSGIVTHPDGKNKKETISDWFVEKYPKAKDVGESIFVDEEEIKKPGIVHRLDRETSGVLILVKNKRTHEFLKEQFQDHKIQKTYLAIVDGWLKNDFGVINKPIGRSPVDFRRRLAGRGARGEMREAITEWKVLKRFNDENSQKFSLLEIYPKTGRTHQIRVHLKYLSCPIVCDLLYNPKGACPTGLSRMGLHAKAIEFTNLEGQKIKIEAPIPDEFEKLIK